MAELEAIKDSKAKALLLSNLRKLCDKYQIDHFEIDDHLSYGENKQHILGMVGKLDQGDLGSREIDQYAQAVDLEQRRVWMAKKSQEPNARHNIIHTRRRFVQIIKTRLEAQGFPTTPKPFYVSVIGRPELVQQAIMNLRDTGYPIRYARTTRNHKPFAYPLHF